MTFNQYFQILTKEKNCQSQIHWKYERNGTCRNQNRHVFTISWLGVWCSTCRY